MEALVIVAWVRLALLGSIVFSSVTGLVELDFRVVPAVVKPLETVNMTLQCTITERTQYHNQQSGSFYYDEWGNYRPATNPPPRDSDKGSIALLRIMKNLQQKWQPIAQISFMAPTSVHTTDHSITASSGLISDNLKSRSFLQVTWAVATANAFGNYRCDTISFDSNQNAVLTTSSELALGSTLNALDLLRLLQHDTANIQEKVGALQTSQRSNQNMTDQMKLDLIAMQNETADGQNKLVEIMKKEHELLEEHGEILKERITDMEAEINKRVNDISEKVQVAVDSGFLMFWPGGNYGLLKPKSGCPSEGLTSWKSGFRRHHTESTDRNQDSVSVENHLQQPVLARERANNFVTQHFCIKSETRSLGPSWPRGSYCINKKRKCPSGFKEGYIRWDEEDDNILETVEGELPDGEFNNTDNTSIEYCCRQDGPADVSMYLPSSDPFYLYRYGGKCQQVYGMNVTEEFLMFDTENTNNDDEFGPVHPDGKINNLRLELCYYS